MSKVDLSLSRLISDISSPTLLEEILDEYNKTLSNNQQYSIPKLIPVLAERIKSCVSARSKMLKGQKLASAKLEEFLLQLNQATSTSSEILAIATAADFGSQIYDVTEATHEDMKALSSQFHKLFLEYNEQHFKASEINFKGLLAILTKMTDLAKKDIYDKNWMLKKLNDINTQLKQFSKVTSNQDWRKALSKAIEELISKYEVVHKQTKLIESRKASNLLISDDLVNSAVELDTQYKDLVNQTYKVVNKVYSFEVQHKQIDDVIDNYSILAKKVAV